METLKVGILYSGGKDSTFAAYLAQQMGHELAGLITLIPKNVESYLFHSHNADLTSLQSEAMGVPLLAVETEGEKERELRDLQFALKRAVERFRIEGVVSGGISSRYQRVRFENVCLNLSLSHISPLWNKNPEEYLRELIDKGFKVIIISVSALGFDRSWLGRTVDARTVEELGGMHRKYGIQIAFEGGEGETYVTDCPLFKKRILIEETEEHWEGDFGYLRIKHARLIPKD